MLDPEPLGSEVWSEVDRFRGALELEEGFAFHVIVADTLDVLETALAQLPERPLIVRPRPLSDLSTEAAATEILGELDRALDASRGSAVLLDAMIAHRAPVWAVVFRRLNELRNGLEHRHRAPLLLAVTPAGETLLGREAPDLWSRRGSGMRLRDNRRKVVEIRPEPLPPPNDASAFESLCLELFREIWNDPGVQRHGQIGQRQFGVDIFGKAAGRWIGVECKLLRSGIGRRILTETVEKARRFEPQLGMFILATTSPLDAKIQELARELSEPWFEVQVWFWQDLWNELSGRPALLSRLLPIYWPQAKQIGEPQLDQRDLGPLTEREASILARVAAADVLHQRGYKEKALARFREAEAIQAELEPRYPLLYSIRGFQYCDLLLAEAERAAGSGQDARGPRRADCREVEQRAARTLEWAELNRLGLLDVALDHLTVGRARLYRAILEGSTLHDAKADIEQAVAGLRRSGRQDHLPRGLLTRAWLRHATGDAEGARADLAETQEIAERGPMPLFLADVNLYRARLFHDRAALAEARRLIDKHGYGRRREELADLASALSPAY